MLLYISTPMHLSIFSHRNRTVVYPCYKQVKNEESYLGMKLFGNVFFLLVDEKPDVDYSDIGGLDLQKQEIREAVELPLTHFGKLHAIDTIFFSCIFFKELYKLIGIDPPRGVLMYGPPGKDKYSLNTSLWLSVNISRLW